MFTEGRKGVGVGAIAISLGISQVKLREGTKQVKPKQPLLGLVQETKAE